MAESRPLALLERYQLSRINVGVPATVCLTALLLLPASDQSSSAEQFQATLAQAVSVLVQRYPLLRSRVDGARTTTPRWTRLDSASPDQFIGTPAAAAELDSAASGNEDAAAVICAAFKHMSRVDPEMGPLWRVWAIEDGKDTATRRRRRWRIVYATNHILTDGTGARNLFADLLTLLHPNHSSLSAPAADEETKAALLPPPMESVFNLSLSFVDMAKVVWSEILAPNLLLLPRFLRSTERAIFHRAPLVPPHAQPTAVPRSFTLPASLVDDLKAAAKSNGVATLHPVLYVAGLAAIEAHKSPPDSIIVGSTPASVRALAPTSLPHATGNYVYEVKVAHPAAARENLLPFWSECRSYAAKLADPATRQDGLKGIGQLSLVPDGPIPPPPPLPSSSSAGVGPTTKYDAWMTERSRKAEPFETTFEISNLGVLPPTGWEGAHGDGGEAGEHELVELAWAQTAMTGTIFAINVRLSSPILSFGSFPFCSSLRDPFKYLTWLIRLYPSPIRRSCPKRKTCSPSLSAAVTSLSPSRTVQAPSRRVWSTRSGPPIKTFCARLRRGWSPPPPRLRSSRPPRDKYSSMLSSDVWTLLGSLFCTNRISLARARKSQLGSGRKDNFVEYTKEKKRKRERRNKVATC